MQFVQKVRGQTPDLFGKYCGGDFTRHSNKKVNVVRQSTNGNSLTAQFYRLSRDTAVESLLKLFGKPLLPSPHCPNEVQKTSTLL